MLDPRRERIQDDLRGLVQGEVLCNTVYTQVYAADASVFEIMPLGVVFPQTTTDVVATVRYARQNGLSIHPRGAGSSCVGGALGEGLVLDMSRYMRRILSQKDNVIRVQAGIQCLRLNEMLRASGWMVSRNFGNTQASTIGGSISLDGFGSHWLASGRPSDWLLGLEVVTASGNVLSFDSSAPIPSAAPHRKSALDFGERYLDSQDEKQRILYEMGSLSPVPLLEKEPRVLNKMGYRTDIFREGNEVDVLRLFAGAEGTLGIITTARIRLQRVPEHRKTLFFLFKSMELATRAVPFLLKFHPDACDLVDRRYLHLAAERDVRFDVMFPPETEAALLVDLSDASDYELRNRVRTLTDLLVRTKELSFMMIPAWDDVESGMFWSLADTLHPPMQKSRTGRNRITFAEDVSVSPPMLYEFFLKVQKILQRHSLTAAFYAHAGQGQARIQPLADLNSKKEVANLLRFTDEYYNLVHSMGGAIGAENGVGFGRSAWLPFFLGEKYDWTRRVKKIFDPDEIFQPGKMGADPQFLNRLRKTDPNEIQHLRSNFFPQIRPEQTHEGASFEVDEEFLVSTPEETELGEPGENPDASNILVMKQVREILGDVFDETGQSVATDAESSAILEVGGASPPLEPLTKLGLNWDTQVVQEIAHKCNGCSHCRGTERDRRMCPVFRQNSTEFASPRAKANLMDGILSEKLRLPEIGDEAFHAVIHQCFQCHSCRLECPAQVDIPFLVRRAEEAWARARGLDFYDSAIVRLDKWVQRLYRTPCLSNFVTTNYFARWLIEKFFGIAKERRLPQIELKSFIDKWYRLSPAQRVHAEEAWAEDAWEGDVEAGSVSEEIRGRVVYFLDTYANHFDTSLAAATVEVFRHNHIPLIIPRRQSGSGVPAVALGRSDYAEKQIYRNAAILADYVRQGFDVILTEPTATLAFRWEYPQTYPHNEDVALVAKHSYDAGEYLYKYHLQRKLRLPTRAIPLKLGYHAPCRLRAMNIGLPSRHLMGLIPDLEIETAPNHCCGMGGTYGLMASNYSNSLKIGRALHNWLRDPTLQACATECSACAIQLGHKAAKPILHPMKVLAEAYEIKGDWSSFFQTEVETF
ncbi:MAG: FAD-linked oxidase C-terminal domain-containing protein [Planctomycetia bacterium]|nr:FAD-linked oxidase C-terminal domain-containing protein [Planctomycetia bacterium]